MSPRRDTRKDENHDELSEAARDLGWDVIDTYQFAQYVPGFPDAIWVKPGRTIFVEYKGQKGRLTKDEVAFALRYDGWYLVRTVDDVICLTEHLANPSGWA
jgi:hypothetical protein